MAIWICHGRWCYMVRFMMSILDKSDRVIKMSSAENTKQLSSVSTWDRSSQCGHSYGTMTWLGVGHSCSQIRYCCRHFCTSPHYEHLPPCCSLGNPFMAAGAAFPLTSWASQLSIWACIIVDWVPLFLVPPFAVETNHPLPSTLAQHLLLLFCWGKGTWDDISLTWCILYCGMSPFPQHPLFWWTDPIWHNCD